VNSLLPNRDGRRARECPLYSRDRNVPEAHECRFYAEAILLGEHDGLDNGEGQRGAVLEVVIGIGAVEAVEELPAGVAQVEEGASIGMHKAAPVVADSKRRLEIHLARRRSAWSSTGGRRLPSRKHFGAFCKCWRPNP